MNVSIMLLSRYNDIIYSFNNAVSFICGDNKFTLEQILNSNNYELMDIAYGYSKINFDFTDIHLYGNYYKAPFDFGPTEIGVDRW